jgi:hypothetical protein
LRNFLKPAEVRPAKIDPREMRYVRSYLIMRTAVGVLGIALPVALVFFDGVLLDGDPFLRTSLSAYYYSGARELFVGGLAAIGVFLITYKVAEANLDNTLSLLAGAAVAVVALFPTGRAGDFVGVTALQDHLGETAVGTIHFIAAGVFILSLALISYQFGKREGPPNPRRGRRSPTFWRNFHWTCAGIIGLALIWCGVTQAFDWGPSRSLLYGEVVAVWAFGASWLWKGLELDMLRGRPQPGQPIESTISS